MAEAFTPPAASGVDFEVEAPARAAAPATARPSLRMLADRPVDDDEQDRLGYTAYADALAELIDDPSTDTPLTLAISAPWGAGKTSLARMVERRLQRLPQLRGEPPHIVCWFNAWMHDDAPHLGAALAADVAKEAARRRTWSRRIASPLPSAMLAPSERWRRRSRIALLAAAAVVGALVLAWWLHWLKLEEHGPLAGLLSVAGVLLAALLEPHGAARAAAQWVSEPRSEASRGGMREVSDQLGALLADATRGSRRIVIFVDDLERCHPPRAVEVCEAASQLLGHKDVVAVLVADMSVIAESAKIKYADLDGGGASVDYGRFYLEKIVQLQFDIPRVRASGMRAVLRDRDAEEPAAVASPQPGPAPPAAEQRRLSWRARGREALYASIRWRVLLPVLTLSLVALTVGANYGIDDYGNTKSSSWIPLFVVGAVVWSIALFVTIGKLLNRGVRLARRAAKQVDEQIAVHSAGAGVDSPEELEQRIIAETSADPRLVKQKVHRHFADDSELRRQAESAILTYLRPLPRSAKRLANHLRLLLVIAIGRKMLGGDPELTAEHLGKWVVLNERWPALARAAAADPRVLRPLEQATSVPALAKELEPLGLSAIASDDLLRFAGQSPLSPVLERLVYLEPATSTEALA